MNSISLLIK